MWVEPEGGDSVEDWDSYLFEWVEHEAYTTRRERPAGEVNQVNQGRRKTVTGPVPEDTSGVAVLVEVAESRTYQVVHRGIKQVAMELVDYAQRNIDDAWSGLSSAAADSAQTAWNFTRGFSEGYLEAISYRLVPTPVPDTPTQYWGQILGNAVVSGQGILETLGGLSSMATALAGCGAAAVTGPGAVVVCGVAAPAFAGGAAVTTAGASHMAAGFTLAFSKASEGYSGGAAGSGTKSTTDRGHNVRVSPKQGRHIKGSPNYKPGRSVLTHTDPQRLLDRFAGTGQPVSGVRGQPGFKERVDFGEIIGEFVDQVTRVSTPTTKGIVHYDGRGRAHIVPARP